MSVGEYEDEPVRGLPEYLPPGETLVWQGEPGFVGLARDVFHVRSVSVYFAILIGAHLTFQLSRGGSLSEILLGSSWMFGLGLTAIAILAGMAWAYARSTVYTMTNKRLVLRFGVAMPMMVNIPLSIITAADMRQLRDGSGDIVLSLEQRKRLSYMMLWPNVRPWKLSPTQPALRCIPDLEAAAERLAEVLADAQGAPAASEQVETQSDLRSGDLVGAA